MRRLYALVAGKFKYLLTEKYEKTTTFIFSCDFLAIYNGDSSTSPMIGKYCGASIPPSHISSSKEIMVHFETDNYNGYEFGFKMEYNPTGKHQLKRTWNISVVFFKDI